MRQDSTELPEVGASVHTSDGQTLGSVAQVLGDYFRVTGGERDYWFGLARIARTAGTRLELDFARDAVLSNDVPPPDHHDDSQYLRPVLTEREQAQRELVLRELSGQRETIRQDAAAPEESDGSVGEPVEEELERRESA